MQFCFTFFFNLLDLLIGDFNLYRNNQIIISVQYSKTKTLTSILVSSISSYISQVSLTSVVMTSRECDVTSYVNNRTVSTVAS